MDLIKLLLYVKQKREKQGWPRNN